ncbi:cell wall glycosyl hydrolase [Xylariales sp. PMI_506]|nr:cell wall glycosyl hydrolase [Xylariales sp. PMI_506]
MLRSLCTSVGVLASLVTSVSAVDIDWTDDSSIKTGASTIAYGLVKYYTGNNTGDVAGNLPSPYYWWEAGAMFGTLIDYWVYTGDDQYNNITYQALQHQVGTDGDFMPENQTKSEGNDDQGFWAMASMTAAEANFTNPPSEDFQWLALTQAVFNEYVERWNDATDTCGGGLRWQIYTFNNGYNYKNSISNGCFFNIAARLARFTGNDTYADWAEKIFQWELDVGFIDSNWAVLDGAGNADDANCTEINEAQFSYNAGIFLYGAAHMYNYTNASSTWETRISGLLANIQSVFFKDGVMWEPPCEGTTCDTDQQSFKGHLARWMAGTTKLAAFTYDTIMGLLTTTAAAAAEQCDGSPASGFKGTAGTACGFSWLDGATYDGEVGVGEQMNALNAVMVMLVDEAAAPYTSTSGGSSVGNANAGSSSSDDIDALSEITTGDRAGAGILTALILGGLLSGIGLMIKE